MTQRAMFSNPSNAAIYTQEIKGCQITQAMFTVYWDTEGVILTHFLPMGHTVNIEIYVTTLPKLRETIEEETT